MKIQRLEKVVKNLKEKKLTQMIVSDPASIFYLTGRWIDPGERLLALYINADGNNKFFINELFTVPEDLGVEKVWFSDVDDYMTLLADCLDKNNSCGVEKTFVAKFLLSLMEKGAATGFINASDCVDQVRACKDEEEKDFMRAVSKINDLGMTEFIKLLKEGMTELDVANKVSDIYKSLGADGVSFRPLVGFGANAAVGHHEPDSTVLVPGDCVLLDVGCKKDDYCADMTRTVYFKSASEKQKEIYDLVKRANEAAEAIIKPGVRFCDIDATARRIIADGGYKENFTHRLGHSIGIEVHEFGDVSSANTDRVQAGMTFSIEPGIYIIGEGGVRIEDLVLVTETGCEVLNQLTKDLTIVE